MLAGHSIRRQVLIGKVHYDRCRFSRHLEMLLFPPDAGEMPKPFPLPPPNKLSVATAVRYGRLAAARAHDKLPVVH